MQAMFTLHYAEVKVGEKLECIFKKEKFPISIFIPTSSQEKGIDMILYSRNEKRNKVLTIQIKSSKAHQGKKKEKFSKYLWFNKFAPQENADLFMITGIYPKFPNETEKVNSNTVEWDTIILVFKYDEMIDLITKIRLKNDNTKDDTKLSFGFDTFDKIEVTRGSMNGHDVTEYLIENRIDMIKNLLI